jgi:ADP-ribose pyrophosphatase YjhB (NUDIX family)
MGGHVEWGEKIGGAVVREVQEEVGLDVVFENVIEAAELVFDPHFHTQKHFVALQSLCHVVGSTEPTIDNDEIQEARWFPLQDAVKLPDLLQGTRQTIEKIIKTKESI